MNKVFAAGHIIRRQNSIVWSFSKGISVTTLKRLVQNTRGVLQYKEENKLVSTSGVITNVITNCNYARQKKVGPKSVLLFIF